MSISKYDLHSMPTSKFTVPLPEEILAYCHVYCVDAIHIIVGVSYAGFLRSQVSSIRVECHLPENVLVSAGRLGRWIKYVEGSRSFYTNE